MTRAITIALLCTLATGCATSRPIASGPQQSVASPSIASERAALVGLYLVDIVVRVGCLGFCPETVYFVEYAISSTKETIKAKESKR